MARRRQRRPNRTTRYSRQAGLEAQLRFGPEQHALSGLLQEARSRRDSQISSAHAAARGQQASARAAMPVVGQAITGAEGIRQAAQNQLNVDLQGLSPAANPFKAASAREQAMAQGKAANILSSAMQELAMRQVNAEGGRAQAIRQAHLGYAGDVEKVGSRLQSMGSEKGAFLLGRVGELREADRKYGLEKAKVKGARAKVKADIKLAKGKAKLDEHKFEVTQAQKDEDQALARSREARMAAGASKGGGGSGRGSGPARATTTQKQNARRDISVAIQVMRDAKAQKQPVMAAKRALLTGTPAADGKAGIPKVGNRDIINAAADVVLRGGVGPVNRRRLAAAGLPIPSQFAKGYRPARVVGGRVNAGRR